MEKTPLLFIAENNKFMAKKSFLKIILPLFIFSLSLGFYLFYNQNKEVLAQETPKETEIRHFEVGVEIPVGKVIDDTEELSEKILAEMENIFDNGLLEIERARALSPLPENCKASNCSSEAEEIECCSCSCQPIPKTYGILIAQNGDGNGGDGEGDEVEDGDECIPVCWCCGCECSDCSGIPCPYDEMDIQIKGINQAKGINQVKGINQAYDQISNSYENLEILIKRKTELTLGAELRAKLEAELRAKLGVGLGTGLGTIKDLVERISCPRPFKFVPEFLVSKVREALEVLGVLDVLEFCQTKPEKILETLNKTPVYNVEGDLWQKGVRKSIGRCQIENTEKCLRGEGACYWLMSCTTAKISGVIDEEICQQTDLECYCPEEKHPQRAENFFCYY